MTLASKLLKAPGHWQCYDVDTVGSNRQMGKVEKFLITLTRDPECYSNVLTVHGELSIQLKQGKVHKWLHLLFVVFCKFRYARSTFLWF